MQLNKILIFIVLVGLMITGISGFMVSVANEYSQNATEFSELNESFNKITEINSQIESYEDQADVDTDSSIADILGNFFTKSYQAALLLKNSVSSLYSMSDSALEQLPPSANAYYLKLGITTIILIAIVVGIFLHFVTKSDRT